MVAAEPPAHLRPRELEGVEPDRDFVLALQRLEEVADPTSPPPDYRGKGKRLGLIFMELMPISIAASCCSMLCCPLVGVAAYWHASQAERQWRLNHHRQAYVHATTVRVVEWILIFCFTDLPFHLSQSRKLAVAAVFYGLMMLLLYLFVRVDNSHGP